MLGCGRVLSGWPLSGGCLLLDGPRGSPSGARSLLLSCASLLADRFDGRPFLHRGVVRLRRPLDGSRRLRPSRLFEETPRQVLLRRPEPWRRNLRRPHWTRRTQPRILRRPPRWWRHGRASTRPLRPPWLVRIPARTLRTRHPGMRRPTLRPHPHPRRRHPPRIHPTLRRLSPVSGLPARRHLTTRRLRTVRLPTLRLSTVSGLSMRAHLTARRRVSVVWGLTARRLAAVRRLSALRWSAERRLSTLVRRPAMVLPAVGRLPLTAQRLPVRRRSSLRVAANGRLPALRSTHCAAAVRRAVGGHRKGSTVRSLGAALRLPTLPRTRRHRRLTRWHPARVVR